MSTFKLLLLTILAFSSCTHLSESEKTKLWLQYASQGNLEKLKLHHNRYGNDIDHANESGTTALMAAASRGHIDMLDWLKSQNANINKADPQGHTAMDFALFQNQAKVLNWLKENGANWQRPNGQPNLLMLAVRNSSLETIEELLGWGFNKMEQDNEGWTVTHHLISRLNSKVLERLLTWGAPNNVISKEFETPLILAIQSRWAEGVEILVKSGVDPQKNSKQMPSPCALAQHLKFENSSLKRKCKPAPKTPAT